MQRKRGAAITCSITFMSSRRDPQICHVMRWCVIVTETERQRCIDTFEAEDVPLRQRTSITVSSPGSLTATRACVASLRTIQFSSQVRIIRWYFVCARNCSSTWLRTSNGLRPMPVFQKLSRISHLVYLAYCIEHEPLPSLRTTRSFLFFSICICERPPKHTMTTCFGLEGSREDQ